MKDVLAEKRIFIVIKTTGMESTERTFPTCRPFR